VLLTRIPLLDHESAPRRYELAHPRRMTRAEFLAIPAADRPDIEGEADAYVVAALPVEMELTAPPVAGFDRYGLAVIVVHVIRRGSTTIWTRCCSWAACPHIDRPGKPVQGPLVVALREAA
jgi:hypothetical protein